MSYTPITWTDKSTLMEAEHMNAMEQALKDHDDAIEQLSNSLAELELGCTYYSSFDDMIADGTAMSTYELKMIFISNNVASTLFGTSGISKGWMAKASTNLIDFFLMLTNGSSMYAVRYNISDAAVSSIYRFNGTSISTTSVTSEDSVD